MMADIDALFHQVHVSHKHINFLCFLWWRHGDTAQPLLDYRMKWHLLGAASSPSCASYTLRITAYDNALQFHMEVVSTVK